MPARHDNCVSIASEAYRTLFALKCVHVSVIGAIYLVD